MQNCFGPIPIAWFLQCGIVWATADSLLDVGVGRFVGWGLKAQGELGGGAFGRALVGADAAEATAADVERHGHATVARRLLLPACHNETRRDETRRHRRAHAVGVRQLLCGNQKKKDGDSPEADLARIGLVEETQRRFGHTPAVLAHLDVHQRVEDAPDGVQRHARVDPDGTGHRLEDVAEHFGHLDVAGRLLAGLAGHQVVLKVPRKTFRSRRNLGHDQRSAYGPR